MRRDHELERDACARAEPARRAPRRCRRASRTPRRAIRAGSAPRARSGAGCARDATPRRRWRAGSRGRTRAGQPSSAPRRARARRPRAPPGRPREPRVPGLAREAPHALDVGQQILADLLDEHTPERVADQADVAPQRVVATARRARGRIVGGSARHARSLWASASRHARAVARIRAARRGGRDHVIGNVPRRELTLRFGLQESSTCRSEEMRMHRDDAPAPHRHTAARSR